MKRAENVLKNWQYIYIYIYIYMKHIAFIVSCFFSFDLIIVSVKTFQPFSIAKRNLSHNLRLVEDCAFLGGRSRRRNVVLFVVLNIKRKSFAAMHC